MFLELLFFSLFAIDESLISKDRFSAERGVLIMQNAFASPARSERSGDERDGKLLSFESRFCTAKTYLESEYLTT
jgi:hypothetical protein